MVVLICLEDGKECRKSVTIYDATQMALKQNSAYLFGVGEKDRDVIIGVESGDDDGFIMALISVEGMDPEDARVIIEETTIEE